MSMLHAVDDVAAVDRLVTTPSDSRVSIHTLPGLLVLSISVVVAGLHRAGVDEGQAHHADADARHVTVASRALPACASACGAPRANSGCDATLP